MDDPDVVLSGLPPEELPGALRLLEASLRAGWIDGGEAEEWRWRVRAWETLQHGPKSEA